MPLLLKGSCRCNAVRFEVQSHTPVPFMLCYCSICRKQQGGGGFAINLGADYETLKIKGKRNLGVFRAEIEDDEHPTCEISTGERNFCRKCGSALWLYDPTWPDLVHPFASAIDSSLPVAPSSVHMMLRFKPEWVTVQPGPKDVQFDLYPAQSLEDWHKAQGLYVP